MGNRKRIDNRSRRSALLLANCLAVALVSQTDAQTEQQVDVNIRDFTFVSTQKPLMLNAPVAITIHNEDGERHDFRSSIFQGISTQVETGGATTYGRGIAGVFVNPKGNVVIRFTAKRPGRYEFRCSIHPKMKGELFLLNIQAV
jgi:plastocyanin